jgi:hypothetical protein
MRKPAASTIWEYGRKYHGCIYGGRFKLCFEEYSIYPYDSYENGSAMRAIAVCFEYNDL